MAARIITDSPSNGTDARPVAPVDPVCPNADGTTYTAANGLEFVIECNTDRPGGNVGSAGLSGEGSTWLVQRMEASSNDIQCVDVTLNAGECFMHLALVPPSRSVMLTCLISGLLYQRFTKPCSQRHGHVQRSPCKCYWNLIILLLKRIRIRGACASRRCLRRHF